MSACEFSLPLSIQKHTFPSISFDACASHLRAGAVMFFRAFYWRSGEGACGVTSKLLSTWYVCSCAYMCRFHRFWWSDVFFFPSLLISPVAKLYCRRTIFSRVSLRAQTEKWVSRASDCFPRNLFAWGLLNGSMTNKRVVCTPSQRASGVCEKWKQQRINACETQLQIHIECAQGVSLFFFLQYFINSL